MTAEELRPAATSALQGRGRRRHPLAHAARARTRPRAPAYFTRGTTRDPYARYSERGPDYVYNVERLLKKFATAATLVPAAGACAAAQKTGRGDLLRLHQPGHGRGAGRWPGRHPPRRDAAARLPVPRLGGASSSTNTTWSSWSSRTATRRCARCWSTNWASTPRLTPVLHYDGTPITARFITRNTSPNTSTLVSAASSRGAAAERRVSSV